LANRVANDFVGLWNQAKPQGTGNYWPKLTQEELTINFSNPVDMIMRQVRALGLLECLAHINGVLICIRRAVGWTELHSHVAGTVVYVNNKSIVVAAQNGYIGLIDWNVVSAAPATDRP
jgi:methionyl-tRNA formyltransferase